jgi:hypothetical protein
VQRAIILNRPRLKYWLSVGAQSSDGVMHLLGKADFLPPRPPKYGTSTLYERSVPAPESIKATIASKYGGLAIDNWEQVAEQDKHKEEPAPNSSDSAQV